MIGVPEEGVKVVRDLLVLDFNRRVTAKELMDTEFVK